jgi:Tfp pilus assembly protein PilO
LQKIKKMKLKILFAPFALVLSVILAIWFIWPAYGLLKSQMKDLGEKKETLQSIIDKKKNVQVLVRSLEQNTEREKFIASYLPSKSNEEKIINSVNFLADSHQLNLMSVNIEKPKNTAVVSNVTTQNLLNNTVDQVVATGSGRKEIQYLGTSVSVAGSYEQIVKFVNIMNKSEFLGNVESFEISSQSGENQQPSSQSLNCNLKVNFGYLAPVSIGNDLSAPILSQSKFDFGKLDQVIQSITEKASVLEDGTKGRPNPFLP